MHHILCSHTTHRIGSVGNSWKERSGLLFLVFGQLSAAHQAQCVFSKYYPSSLLPTPTHMCSCLPCLSFRYQRRSVYGQNPEEKSLASIEARWPRPRLVSLHRLTLAVGHVSLLPLLLKMTGIFFPPSFALSSSSLHPKRSCFP